MARSRRDTLEPVYMLVAEASGHLSDGRQLVPRDVELLDPRLLNLVAWIVAWHEQTVFDTERRQSLVVKFARRYRTNQKVYLHRLTTWLQMRAEQMENFCIEFPAKLVQDPAWAQKVLGEIQDAALCYRLAAEYLLGLAEYAGIEMVRPERKGQGNGSLGGP